MKKVMVYGAALLALATPMMALAQNGYGSQRGGGYGGGYGGGGNRDRGNAINWRDNRRQLEAWLFTDRTEYQNGSGVRMRLTLTNLQDKMITHTLQPKGEYEIVIRDMRSNKIVWTRTRTQNRNGILQISPNGTVQWQEIWDQRDNAGKPLPMGTYRIEASVLGLPLNAQIFLSERGGTRPEPGEGGGNTPGPGNGPGNPFPPGNPGGPGNAFPPGNGNDPSQAPVQQAVQGMLSLSRTVVKPGDALRFTYTVVNTTRKTVTLSFRTTQMFDAIATLVTRNPVGTRTPVWRFSEGLMAGQAFTNLTLEPGQSRTFSSSFRVPSNLTPGQALDVRAYLIPSGAGNVGAATTRLQIN